jgi:hypothetical protein
MFDDLHFSEAFAQFLVDRDVVAPQTALQALDLQRDATPPIGRLALEEEVMTMKQVMTVLAEQADTGLRFGEQAVRMGYLETGELTRLLELQRVSRPGLSAILYDMGALTRRQLQTQRRAFLRELESVLV